MSLMKRILRPYHGRPKYWSHSKLSKYVAKKSGLIPAPESATMEDWKSWRELNAACHPIAFYITDTLFNSVQDVIMYPVDVYWEIKHYWRCRFRDKTHITSTGTKKGEWQDLTGQIVYILFNRFETFILKEKGRKMWCSSDEERAMDEHSRALAHLDWEIALGEESPYQAESAKEQKELYLWWISWKKHKANENEFVSFEKDEENCKIEDEMMHRLINIRQSLWT